jgi:hypothetical protein
LALIFADLLTKAYWLIKTIKKYYKLSRAFFRKIPPVFQPFVFKPWRVMKKYFDFLLLIKSNFSITKYMRQRRSEMKAISNTIEKKTGVASKFRH